MYLYCFISTTTFFMGMTYTRKASLGRPGDDNCLNMNEMLLKFAELFWSTTAELTRTKMPMT